MPSMINPNIEHKFFIPYRFNIFELFSYKYVLSLFCLGNDPSTDLRGCGILGLVNLIYLITSPDTMELSKDIYKLSQHETQVKTNT